MTILDIETKPRVDWVRRFVKPPEPFDPDGVKYGNTRDPAKRAELLRQKELDHAAECEAYWDRAEERAALNPLTAEIICIGLLTDGEPTILTGPEPELLREFWTAFSANNRAGDKFHFWSGNGLPGENFDPDMIIKRSWVRGVAISPLTFNGRFLSNRFEDVAGRYLLYRRDAYCGLSRAADELSLFVHGADIFPKSEADRVRGENFWRWWEGSMSGESMETQRALATRYLVNDLKILAAICGRLY